MIKKKFSRMTYMYICGKKHPKNLYQTTVERTLPADDNHRLPQNSIIDHITGLQFGHDGAGGFDLSSTSCTT